MVWVGENMGQRTEKPRVGLTAPNRVCLARLVLTWYLPLGCKEHILLLCTGELSMPRRERSREKSLSTEWLNRGLIPESSRWLYPAKWKWASLALGIIKAHQKGTPLPLPPKRPNYYRATLFPTGRKEIRGREVEGEEITLLKGPEECDT